MKIRLLNIYLNHYNLWGVKIMNFRLKNGKQKELFGLIYRYLSLHIGILFFNFEWDFKNK